MDDSQSPLKSELLRISVDEDASKESTIVIREGDNPDQVAHEYCREQGFSEKAGELLAK